MQDTNTTTQLQRSVPSSVDSDWKFLPCEILESIFGHFGNQDLTSCHLVCVEWRSVAQSVLYKYPNFTHLGSFEKRAKHLVQVLKDHSNLSPLVHSIRFSFDENIRQLYKPFDFEDDITIVMNAMTTTTWELESQILSSAFSNYFQTLEAT